MDKELNVIGEYGLKNKREVWRVNYTMAKIRAVARALLTLPEKDPKRVFEGDAMMRRLKRLGLLEEGDNKLDLCLNLTLEKFLDRRLQSRLHQALRAKSIHHSRCLIKQKHIRVGKRVVDCPSFMVRVDSEKHIDFAITSPFNVGTGRPGRVARKAAKNKGGDDAGAGSGDEDM